MSDFFEYLGNQISQTTLEQKCSLSQQLGQVDQQREFLGQFLTPYAQTFCENQNICSTTKQISSNQFFWINKSFVLGIIISSSILMILIAIYLIYWICRKDKKNSKLLVLLPIKNKPEVQQETVLKENEQVDTTKANLRRKSKEIPINDQSINESHLDMLNTSNSKPQIHAFVEKPLDEIIERDDEDFFDTGSYKNYKIVAPVQVRSQSVPFTKKNLNPVDASTQAIDYSSVQVMNEKNPINIPVNRGKDAEIQVDYTTILETMIIKRRDDALKRKKLIQELNQRKRLLIQQQKIQQQQQQQFLINQPSESSFNQNPLDRKTTFSYLGAPNLNQLPRYLQTGPKQEKKQIQQKPPWRPGGKPALGAKKKSNFSNFVIRLARAANQ